MVDSPSTPSFIHQIEFHPTDQRIVGFLVLQYPVVSNPELCYFVHSSTGHKAFGFLLVCHSFMFHPKDMLHGRIHEECDLHILKRDCVLIQ